MLIFNFDLIGKYICCSKWSTCRTVFTAQGPNPRFATGNLILPAQRCSILSLHWAMRVPGLMNNARVYVNTELYLFAGYQFELPAVAPASRHGPYETQMWDPYSEYGPEYRRLTTTGGNAAWFVGWIEEFYYIWNWDLINTILQSSLLRYH